MGPAGFDIKNTNAGFSLPVSYELLTYSLSGSYPSIHRAEVVNKRQEQNASK